MFHSDRPTQISAILKNIGSGKDAGISAELETYIADLESNQRDRSSRIAAILKTIASHYPADTAIALEVYISELEAKQQVVVPDNDHSSYDPENLPVWSHQRSVERDQRHQQHALNKANNYQ